MTNLAITLPRQENGETCGLCGTPIPDQLGPGLALADRLWAVCQPCGKEHAPSLAALLNLAHVALRVGQSGRHTLVPPMEALLELASAADGYVQSLPKQ